MIITDLGFNPYIIQDSKGPIIDDTQGYGYKTIGNAYHAHKYKIGKSLGFLSA